MMKSTVTTWLAVGVAALFAAGCGGGGGGTSAGSGTLRVSLTDAPACGYDNVFVTVSKVRVHQSETASGNGNEAGWTEVVLNPAKKIDLLELRNAKIGDPTLQPTALEVLGQTPLSAGHYSQVRLVLEPNQGSNIKNYVVLTGNGGSQTPLDTPSGTTSGYKLKANFDVSANELVDLVLDFDACKSIVKAGNSGKWNLKPVVNVTPMVVSGEIHGFVDPAAAGASVSAQQSGKAIKTSVIDSNGEFHLAPLVGGQVYNVVITANNFANTLITGVPVTKAAATDVSVSAAPIVLDASPMNAASGNVAYASPDPGANATVRALQKFATGEAMEVGAAVVSANYSLSLPTVAPKMGAFTATLPIAFTADGSAAGKFTLEGVAADSTGALLGTIAHDIDVSAGAVTQDFAF